MNSILLAPHNDDETLFAAYTCLRENPLVTVCFQSVKQEADGVMASDREFETSAACAALGVSFEQWLYPDTEDDPGPNFAADIFAAAERFDHCYAPWFEQGGHHQHNLVSMLAGGAFGTERITFYATYVRGHGRTRGRREVPREPGWAATKLAAMACYASQIDLPATQPWFACDWLEEWYA